MPKPTARSVKKKAAARSASKRAIKRKTSQLLRKISFKRPAGAKKKRAAPPVKKKQRVGKPKRAIKPKRPGKPHKPKASTKRPTRKQPKPAPPRHKAKKKPIQPTPKKKPIQPTPKNKPIQVTPKKQPIPPTPKNKPIEPKPTQKKTPVQAKALTPPTVVKPAKATPVAAATRAEPKTAQLPPTRKGQVATKTAAHGASPPSGIPPRGSEPPPPSTRAGKVELAPRHVMVAPSIPIPVKILPKRPTLEQRARRIDKRLTTQSADFRNRYSESLDMSWIYHDTALEGVVYTFEEMSAAFHSEDASTIDSSLVPIYEAIRFQKMAIAFVRDAAEKKRVPASLDLLKRIYVILHPEEGDTKTVKYRRDVPQHRTYFHEYAPPDRIAYLVRQTVDWVNDPENKKNFGVLRIAARAHYDLARTYPFTQDSGKVARLFMNFLLIRGGLPPAIIHATERQRYYEALKNANPGVLSKMLRDSVDNSIGSIEKLLDEHETKKRGFVS